MKKITSVIVILSFLYGNCVYAIPADTLSAESTFMNPGFGRIIDDLTHRLSRDLLPPKEVIRIVEEHLAQIADRGDENPGLRAYIDSLLELKRKAEDKLKIREKIASGTWTEDQHDKTHFNLEEVKRDIMEYIELKDSLFDSVSKNEQKESLGIYKRWLALIDKMGQYSEGISEDTLGNIMFDILKEKIGPALETIIANLPAAGGNVNYRGMIIEEICAMAGLRGTLAFLIYDTLSSADFKTMPTAGDVMNSFLNICMRTAVEIKSITRKEFPDFFKKAIEDITDEVVTALFNESGQRDEWRRRILDDIGTYYLGNYIPVEWLAPERFKERRKVILDSLRGINYVTNAAGAFNTVLEKIGLNVTDDNLMLRATLKHELIHYLAKKGVIRIDDRWEFTAYSVDLADRIIYLAGRRKEGLAEAEDYARIFTDEYGPAGMDLYKKGKEIAQGEEGAGYILRPYSDGKAAGYFSINLLVLEAIKVYEKLGLPTGQLKRFIYYQRKTKRTPYEEEQFFKDQYAAQHAAGVIMAGILVGEWEKKGIDPVRNLKDYFDELYSIFSPPSAEDLAILKELERLALTLFGLSHIEIKPADSADDLGLWRYIKKDEFSAEIGYFPYTMKSNPGTDPDRVELRRQATAYMLLAYYRCFYSRDEKFERRRPGLFGDKVFEKLWGFLLIPRAIFTGNKALTGKDIDITGLRSVFDTLFNLDNEKVENQLFQSYPLHLQYINSILYRWSQTPAGASEIIEDKRVIPGSIVYNAIMETKTGWQKIFFQIDQYSSFESVLRIIEEEIWPVYKRLFEEDLRIERDRKLIEKMEKEEELEHGEFDPYNLTPEQERALEEYFNSLPKEVQDAIIEAVMEMMAGAGMGEQSKGKKGKGRRQGERHDISDLGDALEELAGLNESLQELVREMSGKAKEIAEKGGKTGEVGAPKGRRSRQQGASGEQKGEEVLDEAKDLQGKAVDLKNRSEMLGSGAEGLQEQAGDVTENLPVPETGKGLRNASGDLGKEAEEQARLADELVEKANNLVKQAEDLKDLLDGDKDVQAGQQEGMVKQAGAEVQETADEISDSLDRVNDAIDNVRDSIRKLGEITDKKEKGREREKDKDSKSRRESGPGADTTTPGTKLDIPPDATTLNNILEGTRPEGSRRPQVITPKRPQRTTVPQPDPRLLAEQALQDELLRTGLTVEELKIYKEWRNALGEDLISEMHDRFSEFLIKRLGIKFVRRHDSGELVDPVAAREGEKGFEVMRKKKPVPVYFEFIIDKSGSMEKDRILWAKLTIMLMLEVIFEINDEYGGTEPLIEFEIMVYDGKTHTPLLNHRTSQELGIDKKPKLIYMTLAALVAGGSTEDKQALVDATARAKIETFEKDKVLRLVVNIQDGNFGDASIKDLIDQSAENDDIVVLVASTGDKEANRNVIAAAGEENSIIPKRLRDLPEEAGDKILGILDDRFPQKDIYAYFNEKGPGGIDPEIREIFENNQVERFWFIKGTSDSGERGALEEAKKYEDLVSGVLQGLAAEYPQLDNYAVAVLKGVNFSGHYGVSRRRIYMPLIILEIAEENPGIKEDLIKDFILHHYLENLIKRKERGLELTDSERIIADGLTGHESVVQYIINKTQKDIYSQAERLYRERLIPTGYRHFFYQAKDNKNYLVYRRKTPGGGMVEYRWERGQGGRFVPPTVTVDNDYNEDMLLNIFKIMYEQGVEYTSYSPDGRFFIREEPSGDIVLVKREDSDTRWRNSVEFRFSPDELRRGNIGYEIKGEGRIGIKTESGIAEIKTTTAFSDTLNVSYSTTLGGYVIYDLENKRVVATKIDEGGVKIECDLTVEKYRGGYGKKILCLEGEPGLGKDELIRAAAHLMNEEVYYVPGHSEAERGDFEARHILIKGQTRYIYSPLNNVQHYGGWCVISEGQYIPQETLDVIKKSVASFTHRRPVRDPVTGKMYWQDDIPNHPRCRILMTSNIKRKGIKTEGIKDEAFLDRMDVLHFVWQNPSSEKDLLVDLTLRKIKSERPDISKEELETMERKLDEAANALVQAATHLRMTFMGYDDTEREGLVRDNYKDWDEFLRSADFKKSGVPAGANLRRAPSPRVLANIIEFISRYPKTWEHSPWSVIEMFFNFNANDMKEKERIEQMKTVKERFQAVPYAAGRYFKDEADAPPVILDEESFRIEGEYLIVTPKKVEKDGRLIDYWDQIRIWVHPEARKAYADKLPEEIGFWLKTKNKKNSLVLYRMLQARACGMNVMCVGDAATGKSFLSEGVTKLLSGPKTESCEMSPAVTMRDLTWRPVLDPEGDSDFEEGPVLRAVKNNKTCFIDEICSGRPGAQAGLNEAFERKYVVLPDGNIVYGGSGFGFITTANTPGGPFNVEAPSDEFIERSMVLRFEPLTAEEMYEFLITIKGENGMSVNPRIIGQEDIDPATGQTRKIRIGANEEKRYTGLAGVTQYLRFKVMENPEKKVIPRVPGFRTWIELVRWIISYWETEDRYGRGDKRFLQKQLWNAFKSRFKQNAKDMRILGQYESIIREAFKASGLWSEDEDIDAVEKYLSGEDMRITKLGILKIPDTGDNKLDRILIYIQETTRGGGVEARLKELEEKVKALSLDKEGWSKLSFANRLDRLYKLRGIWQVLKLLTEKRGFGQGLENYLQRDYDKMREIMTKIQSRIFEEDWPPEFLKDESNWKQLEEKWGRLPETGRLDVDDLLGKIAINDDKAGYIEKLNQIINSIKAELKDRHLHQIVEPLHMLLLIDEITKLSLAGELPSPQRVEGRGEGAMHSQYRNLIAKAVYTKDKTERQRLTQEAEKIYIEYMKTAGSPVKKQRVEQRKEQDIRVELTKKEIAYPAGYVIPGAYKIGTSIIYKVKDTGDKYNYISGSGNLISRDWFVGIGDPVEIGGQCYFTAQQDDDRWNIIKSDGSPISSDWFVSIGAPVGIGGQCYFMATRDDGRWNIIKPGGRPINNDWFRNIGHPVEIGGQCYFTAQRDDDRWNIIKPDGRPISRKWFKGMGDPVEIGGVYYFMARRDDDRLNVIKSDGSPISNDWFVEIHQPVEIGGKCYFKAQRDDGRWNIIKPDGNPISNDWFPGVGDPVEIGGECYFWAMRDDDRWNIIKSDGNPISSNWFYVTRAPVEISGECYFAAQRDNDRKWNVIKPDGNPISNDWFKEIGNPVEIGGECHFWARRDDGSGNIIKPDGNPISNDWFKEIGNPVEIGGECYFAARRDDGSGNIIKPDGNPISNDWFKGIGNPVGISGECYFAAQRDDDRWNIIKPDGSPILDNWVDVILGAIESENDILFSCMVDDRIFEYKYILKPQETQGDSPVKSEEETISPFANVQYLLCLYLLQEDPEIKNGLLETARQTADSMPAGLEQVMVYCDIAGVAGLPGLLMDAFNSAHGEKEPLSKAFAYINIKNIIRRISRIAGKGRIKEELEQFTKDGINIIGLAFEGLNKAYHPGQDHDYSVAYSYMIKALTEAGPKDNEYAQIRIPKDGEPLDKNLISKALHAAHAEADSALRLEAYCHLISALVASGLGNELESVTHNGRDIVSLVIEETRNAGHCHERTASYCDIMVALGKEQLLKRFKDNSIFTLAFNDAHNETDISLQIQAYCSLISALGRVGLIDYIYKDEYKKDGKDILTLAFEKIQSIKDNPVLRLDCYLLMIDSLAFAGMEKEIRQPNGADGRNLFQLAVESLNSLDPGEEKDEKSLILLKALISIPYYSINAELFPFPKTAQEAIEQILTVYRQLLLSGLEQPQDTDVPAYSDDPGLCHEITIDRKKSGTSLTGIAVDPVTNEVYITTGRKRKVIILNEDNQVEERIIDVGRNANACFATKNKVFVATNGGIYEYEKSDPDFRLGLINDPGFDFKGVVVKETEDGKNIIFKSLQSRISKGEGVAMPLSDPRNMCFTKDGKIAVAYSNSVAILNPDTLDVLYDSGPISEMGALMAVAEDKNGFIYACGEGSDSIFVFKRTEEQIAVEYPEKDDISKKITKRVKRLVMIKKLNYPNVHKPIAMAVRGKELIVICRPRSDYGPILDGPTLVAISPSIPSAVPQQPGLGNVIQQLMQVFSDVHKGDEVIPAQPDVLDEIKDIAGRLAGVWAKIINDINGRNIRFETGELNSTQIQIKLGEDTTRQVSAEQKLPCSIIEALLHKVYSSDEITIPDVMVDRLQKKIQGLSEFFRTVSKIVSLDNLPEVPAELMEFKKDLYNLLMLGEDGKPKKRKRVKENFREVAEAGVHMLEQIYINNRIVCFLSRNAPHVSEVIINIEGDESTPHKYHLGIQINRNDGIPGTDRRLSSNELPIKNICVVKGTGRPEGYIIVLKDWFYDFLAEDKEVLDFLYDTQGTGVRWQVMSESECSYRGTVDPEFAKLFEWEAETDAKKIIDELGARLKSAGVGRLEGVNAARYYLALYLISIEEGAGDMKLIEKALECVMKQFSVTTQIGGWREILTVLRREGHTEEMKAKADEIINLILDLALRLPMSVSDYCHIIKIFGELGLSGLLESHRNENNKNFIQLAFEEAEGSEPEFIMDDYAEIIYALAMAGLKPNNIKDTDTRTLVEGKINEIIRYALSTPHPKGIHRLIPALAKMGIEVRQIVYMFGTADLIQTAVDIVKDATDNSASTDRYVELIESLAKAGLIDLISEYKVWVNEGGRQVEKDIIEMALSGYINTAPLFNLIDILAETGLLKERDDLRIQGEDKDIIESALKIIGGTIHHDQTIWYCKLMRALAKAGLTDRIKQLNNEDGRNIIDLALDDIRRSGGRGYADLLGTLIEIGFNDEIERIIKGGDDIIAGAVQNLNSTNPDISAGATADLYHAILNQHKKGRIESVKMPEGHGKADTRYDISEVLRILVDMLNELMEKSQTQGNENYAVTRLLGLLGLSTGVEVPGISSESADALWMLLTINQPEYIEGALDILEKADLDRARDKVVKYLADARDFQTDEAVKARIQAVMDRLAEEGSPDAYFGGMTQREINPQIKRILEDPSEKGYWFIRGISDERRFGRLYISSRQRRAVLLAHVSLFDKYTGLKRYGVVVLRGVGFSGHYGRSRKRIYIPLEMLEAVSHLPFAKREEILKDFIEHEYLLSIRKRPKPSHIYEKTRVLYRKHIARKLAETVKGCNSPELEVKINRILMRVQAGKKVELTEVQLHRLLWLIDRYKEINLAPEIAGLVNLILEPDYTGDPGKVIMALEKEILEQVVSRSSLAVRKRREEQKLSKTHMTYTGVKKTAGFVRSFRVPEPAKAEKTHYVLIDKDRAEGFEKIRKESVDKWNVAFVTELPEGVPLDDIVVLVDPEDLDNYKGYTWYLPLIYCEQSLRLAAWLAVTKDISTDSPVFRFVKGFYENILEEEIPDDELLSWFKNPFLLNDRIKIISHDLKFLRIALDHIDKAA